MLTNEWRKAEASNGNGGNNCVEVNVARLMLEKTVLVRDSKEVHLEDGKRTILEYRPAEWNEYLRTLKLGYGGIYAQDLFVIHKDTKLLTFSLSEWEAFMDGVLKGEFDIAS